MRAVALAPLLLAGCWTLDLPAVDTGRVPFEPAVGAPEGWWVEGFQMELSCPDGAPARLWVVYPDAADARQVDDPPALPVALVFHSGAVDFVYEPDPLRPADGLSWRERQGLDRRVGASWAARRIFSTLGLYPSYDATELHAGTLAAALATKGIASVWPTNCWGDAWHNRSSLVHNDYQADLFDRNGRTAAEFAWRYALTRFPPGNPLQLPIRFDSARVYLVGLGDGGRAVGELLSATGPDGAFLYHAAGVVLDHPIDDWGALFRAPNDAVAELEPWRTWAGRVFPAGGHLQGAFSAFPEGQRTRPAADGAVPLARIGLLLARDDAGLPDGVNDALRRRFTASPADPDAPKSLPAQDVWVHESIQLGRPFSNADPALARAVADFLGSPTSTDGAPTRGIDAVDPALVH